MAPFQLAMTSCGVVDPAGIHPRRIVHAGGHTNTTDGSKYFMIYEPDNDTWRGESNKKKMEKIEL